MSLTSGAVIANDVAQLLYKADADGASIVVTNGDQGTQRTVFLGDSSVSPLSGLALLDGETLQSLTLRAYDEVWVVTEGPDVEVSYVAVP